MPENKLQIRAKLLSAIINLQNNTTDLSFVGNTLDDLNTIQDKDTVLEVLHKELLKENSEMRDYTISFLINELVDKEKIETRFFETLANPKIKDSIKAKIVMFLREIGKHVNYEQYLTYFENPDEIIDIDTVKLLENAKINPEAQIDFLDFINALADPEKEMLVESLANDYDGDNLANILIPLVLTNPYSNIAQIAIKSLGESKSNLAYPLLASLVENIDNPAVRANAQKSMSLLRLSGVKEDVTGEYYKKLLADTPVYRCFVNFPDGHGNTGMIFSRKNKNSFIQMFAVVINDIDGIIDCFGFNEITEEEFDRITNKFYSNDKVAEVDESLCKYLLHNAEKISRLKYEEIPYEYAAWSMITKDVNYQEFDLKQGLNSICLNDELLKQLYDKNYFDKWFFDTAHNEDFAKIIDKIADNKLCDIKEIEKIIEEGKNTVFCENFMKIFDNRLLLTAYLAKISEEQTFADLLFSLIPQSSSKEKLVSDILKKSVYEYFLTQKERYENLKNATSIFTRRANKDLQNIDIKYIQNCIKTIEENWM